MDKLVCSICGFESNQRKFKYKDINEHFENALEIWCPTKKCMSENKDKRIKPNGCIMHCWLDYCGWYTIENPKVIDIETAKSMQKAKQILEIGLQKLEDN